MWLALILTCFFFFCNILVFVFNKEWLFRFYLIYIFHCFKHRGRIFFWLLSFFYLSFYSLCFFQYNKTVNIDRYFISFLTKYFFLVVISWLILSNLKFFWRSSDKNVILLFVWCPCLFLNWGFYEPLSLLRYVCPSFLNICWVWCCLIVVLLFRLYITQACLCRTIVRSWNALISYVLSENL